MTYIVLARRYRPQQFADIIGQDHVSKTMANAIKSKRIAHAYILAGPRGVGKTTTARIMAKALNCEQGPTPTPCNECSNCTSITKGSSLDVLEIDGASNRGIDEIRNLRENIRFTPSQGKYRLYIIDEVHMLTKDAFNALLKTLEEPPAHAVFIFATTEIHRVPATILSRCQRFDFKRIPTKTIIEHLKAIARSEKIKIEEEALLQIAKKADGSMRDAQSILDQIISYSGTKISAAEVAGALGIIDQDLYFEFTERIREGDVKSIMLLCQKVNSEGYDLDEFLSGFEEHFRNILVVKTLGNFDQVNIAEHYHDKYLSESKLFAPTDLLIFIQQIGDLQAAIKWAPHPYVKFELGILKLAKLPTTLDIEQLLAKIDLLKKKDDLIPAPPDDPGLSQSEEIELTLNSIQSTWPQLIEKYNDTKVNLANALEIANLKSLDDQKLTVEYSTTNKFHSTWLSKNKRLVEEELYSLYHKPIKLNITHFTPPEGEKVIPATKKDLSKELAKDPVLNKLIEDLGLELT